MARLAPRGDERRDEPDVGVVACRGERLPSMAGRAQVTERVIAVPRRSVAIDRMLPAFLVAGRAARPLSPAALRLRRARNQHARERQAGGQSGGDGAARGGIESSHPGREPQQARYQRLPDVWAECSPEGARPACGPAPRRKRFANVPVRAPIGVARPVQPRPPMIDQGRRYVVILAGGEGNRLASLTRALYGTDLPKQFAVLAGEHSLLQTTIERAAMLATLDRVMVVVSAHHEAIARAQIAPYPGVELVVQPANLDTAPGILLPLVRILSRDPHARVVFLPSDHYLSNVEPLHRGLLAAEHGELAGRLMLIGVAPTGPEVEYGWIVPADRIGGSVAYEVERFHEKPTAEVAEQLWALGSLWNTFILAGPAKVFWDLARSFIPAHVAALELYAASIGGLDEAAALATAYRGMTSANFSRDVLAHAPALAVVPVTGSGWSDWGSPARVFASLKGTENHDRLVVRIRDDAAIV